MAGGRLAEPFVEDGNPFTGGQRSEDDPSFAIGIDPLIGFDEGDPDDGSGIGTRSGDVFADSRFGGSRELLLDDDAE